MATYLQGVTDYIPQYQPFTPNLNFYDTILKTKQNQYDSNWKQLNNIYGKYFYADLTRDDNIKKKDELIKNIDFNLQRVAGLDLSLQKNVDQAVQVFTPFYEDKNLMKDMAYTKNWNSEYGGAMGLQKSADEKRQKQFWNAGIQELQFLREEFKNASAEEAMTFASPTYTPYVNSTELAHDLAKKQGWNVKVSKSDGRHIYTTKNGQQIMEPLRKLFENTIGNDSRVQAVYRTQSYVNRKNFANTNAAMFNGDVDAAEMKYLQKNFNILKRQSQKYYMQLQADADLKDKEIAMIEEKYQNKELSPRQAMYLDDLKFNRDINRQTLNNMKKEYGEFNQTSSSTANTSTGFTNPYGDLNTLRRKVDGGVSQMLMRKDLSEAAQTEAFRNYEVTMKTDAYGLEKVKNANRRSLTRLRGSIDRENIKYQNGLKNEAKINELLEKKGILRKKMQTREYKDINGVRYFKDQMTSAQWSDALAAKGARGKISQPILGANGNILYENDPTNMQPKSGSGDEDGQTVVVKNPNELKTISSQVVKSLGTEQAKAMQGLPKLYENLRANVGKEGGLTKAEWEKIQIRGANGQPLDVNEMYKNINQGFNADRLTDVYSKLQKLYRDKNLKSDLINQTMTNSADLFSASKDATIYGASKRRETIRTENEAKVEKINAWSNATGNLLDGKDDLVRAMVLRDAKEWDRLTNEENGKYILKNDPNLAKQISQKLGFTGDMINWLGKKITGEPNNVISADSMFGQLLGVDGDINDLSTWTTSYDRYSGDKGDINISKSLYENLGAKPTANGIKGDWIGYEVGDPQSESGEDFTAVTDAILKSPNPNFSVRGTSADAFSGKLENDITDDQGKALWARLVALQNSDSKESFRIEYSPISKNSIDNEGVKISGLSPKLLKELTKDEKGKGLLSIAQANYLQTGALYVSLPKGTLSGTTIYSLSQDDPLETLIKTSGANGYTYNHPDGEGSLNVKYDKKNNSYTTTSQYELLMGPDKNGNLPGYQRVSYPDTYMGGNWQEYFDGQARIMSNQGKENQKVWNDFYREAYEEGPENPTYQMIRQQINNQEYTNGGDIKWFDELPEGVRDISEGRIFE